jgi:hypothetical protein
MPLQSAKIITCAVIVAASTTAKADIINLNPVADAFVSSAQPTGNFGGAGALCVAAPGLALGEFQTLLRFDSGAAVAAFNGSYGPGNWVITNIALTFTSTTPSNPIFNAVAAGNFAINWMQNDSWVEGTGGPSAPAATGINFSTLPGFLGPTDEFLGTFAYAGGTTGSVVCQPIIAPGFAGDVGLGNLVSFRLAASTATTSWVFNSRSFGTVANRPVLSITAVPAPGAAALLLIAGTSLTRRRR